MAAIASAKAYANNEIALIAWKLGGRIEGCLGFDVVRIRLDAREAPKGLATWVPFPGQRNPNWIPQDTGVWPVQRCYWRDLTLRQHRDDLGRRESNFTVKYAIRPVGDYRDGLERVPVRQDKTYDGDARPLGYLAEAALTNPVAIGREFDGVRASFTNGILAAQWLGHALKSEGKTLDKGTIKKEIETPASEIRKYLTGDVLETVGQFLTDPHYETGSVRLALYELNDPELIALLIKNKARIEVILSNSSRSGETWDAGNARGRAQLHEAGVRVHDRMFNNNHIGHNKFAVWLDRADKPQAVMTGSTNWTSTGLCAQTNNALVVSDSALAESYDAYWRRLREDNFPPPDPLDAPGHAVQVQGAPMRHANMTPAETTLPGNVPLQAWFSPNTVAKKKGAATPPDLETLFALMKRAKKAIFFLAFLPSVEGADSIISAAIEAADANPDLIVAGAVSDPKAMPNYVAGDRASGRDSVEPFIFDKGGVHIVRAAAVRDVVGDFEREELKQGFAIVHDKIVVIDPLSDNGVVATGSHNMGFKASYENDENLLIFSRAKALASAYATHVFDVYDHYRFRAWLAKDQAEGHTAFHGDLSVDAQSLARKFAQDRDGIASYFG